MGTVLLIVAALGEMLNFDLSGRMKPWSLSCSQQFMPVPEVTSGLLTVRCAFAHCEN